MAERDSTAEHHGSRRRHLLEVLANISIGHPKSVLIAAGVVTAIAAALIFALRIEIVTDRGELVGADDPAQRRYQEVGEMLGSISLAVVVFQGQDRQALRDAATEMAEALEDSDQVQSVFYRLDMSFFHRHALLYLDDEQLDCVEFALGPNGLGTMSVDGDQGSGLLGMVQGIQTGVETASADAQLPEQCQGVNPLVIMTQLFRAMDGWVGHPDRQEFDILGSIELPGGPTIAQYGVDEQGFLIESAVTRDEQGRVQRSQSTDAAAPDGAAPDATPPDAAAGAEPVESQDRPHLVFMLIQPASASGSEDVARALTAMLRSTGRPIAERHGVEVGVTGMPAIITDEMDAVHDDIKQTIVSAIIFVLLLFLLTFRSLRATALVTVPLVLGLVWTAGFAAMVYQQLTMVSVYFAAVLFGLGIAFGIHLLARFEEARRQGLEVDEAVRKSMLGAGPGVITGGVTTAAAFLAVGFVEFKGFAQLGVVAGAGVLLMLVGSLFALPASLMLWKGKPLPEAQARGWLGSVGQAISRAAWPVSIVALITAVAGFWGGYGITFDYDFSKLLPAEAEALRYYRLMQERSDFSSDITISLARSPEEAEELRQRLESLDTVARAEAVTKYLPATIETQRERVRRISQIGEGAIEPLTRLREAAAEAAEPGATVEAEVLAQALQDLGDAVEDAWFAAQQTGRAEAPDLARLRDAIRATTQTIRQAPAERASERLTELQHRMFSGMASGIDILLGNLRDPEVMTATDLPDNVRRRFVARQSDGSTVYAIYAYPTGRIGNREFLERFYADVHRVDEDVTGFPITHYFHGDLARRAFFQAAAYAAIAVLLLLALDFRRVHLVILASIPLGIGAAWMLGVMALLHWNWNFVNVVALPLVLGAGVDFGVHLVHRFRQEGSGVAALRTTGRPVILSAVTTLVGMGGLAMANHRGAASLGWILVVGIGSCLVSASLILPAVMALWSRRR